MEYLSQNPVPVSADALDGEDDEGDKAEFDPNIRRIYSLKWAEFQSLKEAMELIRDVSLIMEGSKYVTSSIVLLHIIRLLYRLWAHAHIQDKTMVFQ